MLITIIDYLIIITYDVRVQDVEVLSYDRAFLLSQWSHYSIKVFSVGDIDVRIVTCHQFFQRIDDVTEGWSIMHIKPALFHDLIPTSTYQDTTYIEVAALQNFCTNGVTKG